MRAFAIRWVSTFLAVMIVAAVLPVFTQRPSVIQAALFAVVLALLNTFIKPIVALLTCPFYVLTLGLFTFIVNALMFWLAAVLLREVEVGGFFSAFLGALAVSVISFAVNRFVK